jgi:hypothetical protein
MYWRKIRKSEHFKEHHEGALNWNELIHLIYTIKNKRKKGCKIEIENSRIYILCEIRGNILYVINVKIK